MHAYACVEILHLSINKLKSSEFDLRNKCWLVYDSQSLDFSLFKKNSLLIRYNSMIIIRYNNYYYVGDNFGDTSHVLSVCMWLYL